MITANIVDDDPLCSQSLAGLLKRYCPQIEITGIFNSGVSALPVIMTMPPQVLFLDIEMPQMNGFELLEQLPAINFELIFTTSYDRYAIKAIRLSALDYLLKPIDREELQKAVEKLIDRRAHPLPQQIDILLEKMHHPGTAISKIALPTMEGLHMISVNSVIRCVAKNNYTIFILKNNEKIKVSRILKDIEEMLEDHSFARVHNSYLVNLNEIEKYVRGEGGYLVMSDGSTVDVSRSRKESLLKRLSPGEV
ncbi:MAG: LytTR family DNA-binding domain-containing protein [Ferruginibacter sp.]